VVDEPAEIDANGPRAESPSETSTRSSGRPSSSAAICAIVPLVPVPNGFGNVFAQVFGHFRE